MSSHGDDGLQAAPYARRRQSHRKVRKLDPLAFALQREKEAAAATDEGPAADGGPAVDAGSASPREPDEDDREALRAQRALGRKRKRAAALVPVGTVLHELAATQEHVALKASTAAISAPLSSQPAAALDAETWGLHPHLRACITTVGVTRFFPVQRDVIPLLLRADATCDPTVGDVSVSAPTGSGKTLVYVLPIMHALLSSRRATRRLQLLPMIFHC